MQLEMAGLQDQLDSQTNTLTTVQLKRDTLKTELKELQKKIAAQQGNITRSEAQQQELLADLAAALTSQEPPPRKTLYYHEYDNL